MDEGFMINIYLCQLESIKQIYISSMQFITNGSELLTSHLNCSFALRRNARIKSSKLPPDFFIIPQSHRDVLSPIFFRQIGADIQNRQPKTPSFQHRKRELKPKQRYENERKVQTARTSLQKIDNDSDLIFQVLCSSNKLRKVVRKQSLDMKQNYKMSIDDTHFRLPKILNKIAQRH